MCPHARHRQRTAAGQPAAAAVRVLLSEGRDARHDLALRERRRAERGLAAEVGELERQLEGRVRLGLAEEVAAGDGPLVDVFCEVEPDDAQPRVLRRVGVAGCGLLIIEIRKSSQHAK